MEKILKAVPLDNFKVEVFVGNGLAGVFDMKPYLGGGVFKPLLQPSFFNQVSAMRYGITWPGELDISSDTVIANMKDGTAESRLYDTTPQTNRTPNAPSGP
jgi:Protein of unknown function (DUF2442)